MCSSEICMSFCLTSIVFIWLIDPYFSPSDWIFELHFHVLMVYAFLQPYFSTCYMKASINECCE